MKKENKNLDKIMIKKDDYKTMQITISVPRLAVRQIDEIVVKIPNMSRNQFLSNLVMIGLDDVKLIDSVGLISAALYIRTAMMKAVETFKELSLTEIRQ